jgi:acetylornithine deacetylase/succinyl-diaminopimelate desuccinylase-like protein
MTDIVSRLSNELPRFREELFDFLRIPSVSADSTRNPDTRRAGQWVVDRMRTAGLEAELLETDGHPVALGSWQGAGAEAPTILIYGHYDVQPAEPLELWSSPPFEPEIREGRIYARGSADDKGQLFLHLAALDLLLRTEARLPVNVIVLAEGEEEIGSPNLLPFLERWKSRLSADAVVISDSAMFAEGLPSLLYSLRGLAYTEIRVQGATSDLHSGAYGGAVPNPAMALARILATLHDDEGKIAISGFLDDVLPWDDETRSAIRDLPFDEAAFQASTGAPGLTGEPGYSTLERLWTRPTCEVNGLLSGYTGEGAKTVLPAKAMAKVSFRLVANQDPRTVVEQLRAHVTRVAPTSVAVEVVELHGGFPWRANPEGPIFEAARGALKDAFGVEPVLTGEGGSIPIVSDFERVLGARAILLGFALPGANMHAPDEWFPDAHLELGIQTLLGFYARLGAGHSDLDSAERTTA